MKTAESSSAEKVFHRMRAEIRKCSYKVGESLPKMSFIASQLHVSSSTVLKAYRRLLKEEYVRQVGKRYIVGKSPSPRATYEGKGAVVAVVVPSIGHWAFLCSKSWLRMFGQAFMLEGERRNVRIRLVPLDAFTQQGHGGAPVLRDILKGGGGSLVGVLFAVTRKQCPSLFFLENGLRAAGVPVVRLDAGEEGAVGVGRLGGGAVGSRIDERAAVSTALGYLHERGHRCIAFIPDFIGDWQIRRLRLMLEAAAEFSPRVCIHSAPSQYEHLEEEVEEIARLGKDGPERIRRVIESFVQDGTRHVKNWGHLLDDRLLNSSYAGYAAVSRAVRSGECPREDVELRIRLMWGAVGLTALMYHPDVTAVVAANDKAARNFIMRSLAELGIRVPEDVSLLSFDNQFRETCAPPTTVEFGFFDLGYKSFHALVGDVPVQINRHNEIRAIPFIVDRDTVGWKR